MNREQLLAFLEEQDSRVLRELLEVAYDEMNTEQRWKVFGEVMRKAKPLTVDGPSLLEDVAQFQRDSLAGNYYAPFDMNSKNYSYIPEATNLWFERLGDLLSDSAQLSQQEDHTNAVACFRILYQLIEAMGHGDEIVFAHEYGTWMIPVDEKKIMAAYFKSLAATSSPDEFTAAAVLLVRRDSFESLCNKTYSAALRAANKLQKSHLKAEVKRQKIRTG